MDMDKILTTHESCMQTGHVTRGADANELLYEDQLVLQWIKSALALLYPRKAGSTHKVVKFFSLDPAWQDQSV